MPRTAQPRPPAAPPANADEGAEAIRLLVLKLFHRPDGDAADWELIAGSLIKAGFHALDKLPEGRQQAFAERLHVRAYERIEAARKIDSGSSKTDPAKAESSPSNTGVLKSSHPRPPR